ncbi:MAG: T9SS type A sorting domain-containing protein [Bacteroidales bacterium]|nr:T9SS type A sorting domain-containing protein [Bacteroidales bacterium]
MRIINIYLFQTIKNIFLFVFIASLSLSNTFAQGVGQKNAVYLLGQITNNINGAPVKNHRVQIISDSTYNPYFIFNSIVYTDSNGFYHDTINTSVNKGSLFIYTYDLNNEYYDTTVYFRFNWSDNNTFMANFKIYDSVPTFNYQANFYSIKDTSFNNPFHYYFFDNSKTNNICSWFWDFGDGTTSIEQNPEHYFSEQGIYKVTLTITGYVSTTGTICINSISKRIKVAIKNYYHMGGHVFGEYFPIDLGIAYLFKVENNDNIVPIDTAYFDTLGYYYFYQVIEGDYLVKADLDPNSSIFNEYMPTYYGNVLKWEEADTIELCYTNFELDIKLIPVLYSGYGIGKLNGNISYAYSQPNPRNVPAPNIPILLFDNDGNPLLCTHSSYTGDFSFENIALSSYQIYPEVTGKYTYPINVTINENNPVIDNIEILINTSTINGSVNSINNIDLISDISEIYPNPLTDEAHIKISLLKSAVFQILIYNQAGQIVSQTDNVIINGDNSIININTIDLQQGLYTLRIKSNDGIEIIKKFIKVDK